MLWELHMGFTVLKRVKHLVSQRPIAVHGGCAVAGRPETRCC
jgi:hypothetical protein